MVWLGAQCRARLVHETGKVLVVISAGRSAAWTGPKRSVPGRPTSLPAQQVVADPLQKRYARISISGQAVGRMRNATFHTGCG